MWTDRTPGHNFGCLSSMTFGNALLKIAFISIPSNMYATTMTQQYQAGLVETIPMPYVHEDIAAASVDVFARGESSKKKFLHFVHGVADLLLTKQTVVHL